MSAVTTRPVILSRINERQVLRTLLEHGALSRAEVGRHAGLSAPTVIKAVEALLRTGLVEEDEAQAALRGRPSKRLRLANRAAQVLGLVIDAEKCRIVSAGLDGGFSEERSREFPTPASYEEWLDCASGLAAELMEREGVSTLGLGISVPGLVDQRTQRSVLSPNVPITNGHSPGRDLAERIGVECVMVQEEHALCLAERAFGNARGMDDFAMLDVSTGVGLGVMSGGRLLSGRSGLAGEIGHVTVDLDGRLCGCGNHGCLETVTGDSALAWDIGQRLGRRVSIDEVIALSRKEGLDVSWELARVGRYLAVAISAVINLFNPATVYIHGRLFELDPGFFPRVAEETRRRALAPSHRDCRIVQARGSKRQGAVAAIIERVTNSPIAAVDTMDGAIPPVILHDREARGAKA